MSARTFVITGASDGIGRALAVALAGRGARLVVAARNAAALDETVRRCVEASRSASVDAGGRASIDAGVTAASTDAGGAAFAVPTDVADPDACRRLIATAVERLGGIDVLVNNAGISMQARFDEVRDLSAFEHVMRVNYLGAVYCTHHALPSLKSRRGLIVAVSSLQGKTGFPTYAGYAASKHAMQGFFDSIRIELRPAGVDVLVVSPGAVDTAIHERRLGADGTLHGARSRTVPSMPVDECVRQIVRAIDRRDRELVMTAAGKLGGWLKLVAPATLDRLVADAIRRFDEG